MFALAKINEGWGNARRDTDMFIPPSAVQKQQSNSEAAVIFCKPEKRTHKQVILFYLSVYF